MLYSHDINHSINMIKSTIKLYIFGLNLLNNFEPDQPCTYYFLCPCNQCLATPGQSPNN